VSDESSRSYHARVAGLAAALALGLTSSAWASGGEGGEGDDGGEGGEGGVGTSSIGDSESIDLHGHIPPQCSFTQSPNATDLGALVANAEHDTGTLGFTCNLAALSTVSLTVTSLNGALKRDGGTETVTYSAWWTIPAFAGFSPTAPWTVPFPFAEQTAANGVQKSGQLKIKVTGPTAGLTAGDYRDTLVFTVSP
jgi:hypothetical protein